MDLLRCWLPGSRDERDFMAAEIPPVAAFFYVQDAKCEMRFGALWEGGTLQTGHRAVAQPGIIPREDPITISHRSWFSR